MIEFKKLAEKILLNQYEVIPDYIKITTGVLDEYIATAIKTHGNYTEVFIIRDLSYKKHNSVSVIQYELDYRGVRIIPALRP